MICTLRMNVPVLLTSTGACQVTPLSVEKVTERAPWPTLKSFQETYMRPKKGELGLLSAQPDSRSSSALVVNAKMGPAIWVPGSGGLVPAQGSRLNRNRPRTHCRARLKTKSGLACYTE